MQEGKILSLAYIYQKIKGEKNIHDGDVSNYIGCVYHS